MRECEHWHDQSDCLKCAKKEIADLRKEVERLHDERFAEARKCDALSAELADLRERLRKHHGVETLCKRSISPSENEIYCSTCGVVLETEGTQFV